jgi:NADPH:quinone reductase-like Zn-dependent oxidoreductase
VLEEVPDPTPGPGETVVRIAAAGAGQFDLSVARGEFEPRPALPYTPGTDGAGQVVASAHFKQGTWVRVGGGGLGLRRDGTWAELAVAPDEALQPIPAGVDPAVAASFSVPAAAAHTAVHGVGRLQRGERVAVTGASGGVGSVAVQLAARGGASEVLGVVSRPQKAGAVPVGATVVVGRGAGVVADLRGTTPGVDLLVDTVGGPALAELVPAVAPGGRIVLVGSTAGPDVTFSLPALLDGDVALLPMNLSRHPARTRQAADVVLELLQSGAVSLPMTTFPLADLDAALDALAMGRTVGRVVLLP